MGTKVILNIPDYIYQQAQEIANKEKMSVNDVFNEVLIQTFPQTHVNPQRNQMEKEQSAFWELYQSLLSKYQGEYVAIYQGQVIDHDPSRLSLARRLDEKYPNETILIKLVTSDKDYDLQMRSPRL